MSNEKKFPKAMHRGKLPIGNLELDCYVLDDAKRILSSSSIFEAFERPSRGIRQIDSFEHHGQLIDLPLFLASKTLLPLMKPNVLPLIEPVEFLDGGTIKKGYKAELLPAMCSIYLNARRQNLLPHHQKKLADKSEILLSAIANIGIITLVDEATGFQINRKSDALRIILKKYIAEVLQKLVKQFDDDFFQALDRLYQNEKTTSRARPQYYGKFINQYVCKPLENGYVKAELNKLNITEEGKRKAQFHRWLTKDDGVRLLARQIGRATSDGRF